MSEPALVQQETRPPTAASETTITHANEREFQFPPAGISPSTAEESKSMAIEVTVLERDLGDNYGGWDQNPANARNWPAGKKWTAVAIVCHFPHSCESSLTMCTGCVLHVCCSARRFLYGPSFTSDCEEIWYF